MAPRTCRNVGALAGLATLVTLSAWPGVARAIEGPGGATSTSVTTGRKLFFRGSVLSIDQSTTPETINPNVQLSPLPSTQTWVSLRPRFYLTDTISLRLRIDLTTEWLAGIDATYKNQPLWGDLWTEGVFTGIPTFGGIRTSVGIRALWPTSLGSQLRGYYTQLGLTAGLSRDFATRIGEFGLSVVLIGTHPFAKSTSGGFLEGGKTVECMAGEIRGTICDRMPSAMNPYFTLTAAMSGHYSPIPPLSLSLAYVVIDSFLYGTPEATLMDQTAGGTSIPRSASDQRFRQAGWFSASVDYDATSWLGLSVGYYVFRPMLNPDSTVGNPFWSPGGNSRLFFSVTFTLDQLYLAVADKIHPPAPAPTAAP